METGTTATTQQLQDTKACASCYMERPRTPPPRSLTNLQIHGVPDRSSSTPAGDPMSTMNQDLLNSYVRNALRPRSIRDSAAYTFILRLLQDVRKAGIVSGLLRALSLNASELTIENSRELLSVIFKIDFTVDRDIQKAFLSLMVELCTSHSTYINQILRSLITHITPKKITSASAVTTTSSTTTSPISPGEGGSSASAIAMDGSLGSCMYDVERSEEVRTGIVKTIREMAKLVPMSSMSILQIFTSLYPYKKFDFFVHRSWLLSALDICRDVPSIREQVLSTVTSRLLQMDVEFRVEYEESGMLYESIIHRSASDALSSEASTSPSLTTDMAACCSELSNKLDVLMDILLAFVTEVFGPKSKNGNSGNNNSSSSSSASLYEDDFNIFLNEFIRYVLPTYDSKVMQFVIFKVCSFNEKYTQAFLDSLMNIIKDEHSADGLSGSGNGEGAASTAARVFACSYVASFLTRANFIKDFGLVENYLLDILSYAKEHSLSVVERSKRQHDKALTSGRTTAGRDCGYRLTSSSFAGGNCAYDSKSNFVYIDTTAHQVFYAAVQAAMHILSYCYPQLLERALRNGFTKIAWLNSLGFQAVLASPLCPLRECNQGIVKTFQSVWSFVAGDDSALKTAYSLSETKYPYISLIHPKAISSSSSRLSTLRSMSTSALALSLSKSSSPTSFLTASTGHGVNSSINGSGLNRNSEAQLNASEIASFPYDPYLLHKSARHITPIYKIYDCNFFNFEALTAAKRENGEDNDNNNSSSSSSSLVNAQRSTVKRRVKVEKRVKSEIYTDDEKENDENVVRIPAKKVKKEPKIKIELSSDEDKNSEEENESGNESEERESAGKTKRKSKSAESSDDDDEEEEEEDDDENEENNDDNEGCEEEEEDGKASEENSSSSSSSEEEDEVKRANVSKRRNNVKQSLHATETTSGFQCPVSITPNFNFSFD